MLLDRGADADKADNDDDAALFYALQGGDQEIIDMVASRTMTVVGLDDIYRMIAQEQVKMTEPLVQFIRDTIGRTGLGDWGGGHYDTGWFLMNSTK